MRKGWLFAAIVMFIGTTALAQEGLTLPTNALTPEVVQDAQAIYLAACSTVKEQFGQTRLVKPRVTLVLGADQDGVIRAEDEVRLRKWDRYLFAQGVVILAFGELMSKEEKLQLTRRAVASADATITVQRLHKLSR